MQLTNVRDISLIPGGIHSDERGSLTFFNALDIGPVKRFYIIEHPDTTIIRAWQGHRHEQKWFYVIAGMFKLAVIKPDNWQQPAVNLHPEIVTLKAEEPVVLHVPGGYATGFSALKPHSQMVVFSDTSVEASQKDDYRFDKSLWSEIWNNE